MELAIYNDFEPRKWKPKKKREPGVLGAEQSPQRPSQIGEEALAVHPEQEAAERDEVTMKILRICANPRLVLCAYSQEGVESRALVKVGKNVNFSVGMELKAIRPAKASEPWLYQGRLPRFRGRW